MSLSRSRGGKRLGVLATTAVLGALAPAVVGASPADAAAATCSGTCVQYNGGAQGVITLSPKVYLVFYGSQWGGQGGSAQHRRSRAMT